jgi:hypothetical protein
VTAKSPAYHDHPPQRLLLNFPDTICSNGSPTARNRPRSLYPTLSWGSLVPVSQINVPYIPAVNFTLPGLYPRRFHLDRGPDFDERDVSGVMDEPPIVGYDYAALAPAVDADGNDVDGLRNRRRWAPTRGGTSERPGSARAIPAI